MDNCSAIAVNLRKFDYVEPADLESDNELHYVRTTALQEHEGGDEKANLIVILKIVDFKRFQGPTVSRVS